MKYTPEEAMALQATHDAARRAKRRMNRACGSVLVRSDDRLSTPDLLTVLGIVSHQTETIKLLRKELGMEKRI